MDRSEPEVLLRLQVPEDYVINAVQAQIRHLVEHLEARPAVIFNFYSQKYGVEIKDFRYSPKAGYLVDMESRTATHRFECKGVERRDRIFDQKFFQPLVPPIYRNTFFDLKDAVRSYIFPITSITEINPIKIEEFELWEGAGKVNARDELHHPRPIAPLS